jgi:hypothetical protein
MFISNLVMVVVKSSSWIKSCLDFTYCSLTPIRYFYFGLPDMFASDL